MSRQRHTPLDAEERALADALAGLPTPEPSPELDSRILAEAARAQTTSRRADRGSRRPQRQRWWLGTGLGTAAAAVCAAGIAWQIGLFDIKLASDVQVPRPQAPSPEPAVMSDAVSIDLKHQSRRPAAASSDETAAPSEAEALRAAPAPRDAAPSAPPPAPPAPPPPVPAPAPPPPPVPSPAAAARAIPSDAITTGAGARAVREMALPHWQQDAQLPPEAWLQRIRERLRHGDQAEARASLAAFRERHPDIALPADLATVREP